MNKSNNPLRIIRSLEKLKYENGKINGLDGVIEACEEQGYQSSNMRRSGNYKIIDKKETSWRGFNLWKLGNAARPTTCYPFLKWVYEEVLSQKMPSNLIKIFTEVGINLNDVKGIEQKKESTVKDTVEKLIKELKNISGCKSIDLHY
jgi:hypothetical protein